MKQRKNMKSAVFRRWCISGKISAIFCLLILFPPYFGLIVFLSVDTYFRKQVPMLYDGDLHQHDRILTWLTSQDVFEIKNEIEEVNRKMLDKLLEENEFLAVYFCMSFINIQLKCRFEFDKLQLKMLIRRS